MDKSLLIHAANTPSTVQELFLNENIINFNYSNDKYSTIDEYISNDIIKQLTEKDFDLIYIKDTLSSNYLELYGLIVAYHIRLSAELKDKKYIPIVILSDIDGCALNKLEPMARILFTQNVFIIKNNKDALTEFQDSKLGTSCFDEKKFLNLITIDAPENTSNHDISNEWAIYRWADFLKIEDEDSNAIKDNKKKIASMLYFKYLLAKSPLLTSDESNENTIKCKNKGKVLLIDDESDKGWGDIFSKFFEDTSIDFAIFNDENNEIERKSIDVVILDLRMKQEDHNQDRKIEDLTGVKFLQKIKKVNPGIQVIMFTATSKSTILEKLYEHGILGYIKKEHPSDTNIITKENFEKLAELVDKGLEKKYLKEIWSIQNEILNYNYNFKEKKEEINVEVKSIFEILDSDMGNKFNYAMFAIFKCIEIVTSLYIEEKNRKAHWIDGDEIENTGYYLKRKEYDTLNIEHINSENNISNKGRGNISIENKIRTIMHEKLDLTCDELHSTIKCLVCIRNHTIHQDKQYGDYEFCNKIAKEEISKENILTWLKMLKTILGKINEKSK